MFIELFEVLGKASLLEIARRFGTDPYAYRNGWADLTIWRDDELRWIEVKARGDALHKSQRKLIKDILLPCGLNYSLADVYEA